jgi:hypothetical protein
MSAANVDDVRGDIGHVLGQPDARNSSETRGSDASQHCDSSKELLRLNSFLGHPVADYEAAYRVLLEQYHREAAGKGPFYRNDEWSRARELLQFLTRIHRANEKAKAAESQAADWEAEAESMECQSYEDAVRQETLREAARSLRLDWQDDYAHAIYDLSVTDVGLAAQACKEWGCDQLLSGWRMAAKAGMTPDQNPKYSANIPPAG